MFKNNLLKRFLKYFLLLSPPLYWWTVSYEPSHPKCTRIPADRLPERLAKTLSGKKILQMSDFHCSRFGKLEERTLSLVEKTDADLIVLTGDYIDYDIRIKEAVGFLKRLSSPNGVIAITGNVDVSFPDSFDSLRRKIDPPISFLLDEVRMIDLGGGPIHLIGLHDPGWFDPERDLARGRKILEKIPEDEPKIVLAHQPDWAVLMEEFSIDLMLCGHTHGGQFLLPFGLHFYKQTPAVRKYPYGLYEIGDGVLYVTSGLGTSDVKMRLGAFPEIVVFG